MKVKKALIPTSSLLRNYAPADYTDSFRITTDRGITDSPDDIMMTLWLDMPVQYNNRLGRVYFSFIRPFHGWVMRAALKRVVGKRVCC